jgi:hypothetical protein
MTHQEQEHIDHELGSATEHQNSHAMSLIELAHRNCEVRAQINALTEFQFVVVAETLATCPVTDGILGSSLSIYSRHATLMEAQQRLEEDAEECHNAEIELHIEPYQPEPQPEALEPGDDEVPF